MACGCPETHQHSTFTGFCIEQGCWLCEPAPRVRALRVALEMRKATKSPTRLRDALVIAHAAIGQNAPALFGVRIEANGPTLGKVITDALKED
jgi:hypothetical protein